MAQAFSGILMSTVASRLVPAALSLLTIPLYTRLIGLESYGIIGFYASLHSLMTLLDFGLGVTVSRRLIFDRAQGKGTEESRSFCSAIETFYLVIVMLIVLAFGGMALAALHGMAPAEQQGLTAQIWLMIGFLLACRFPMALYNAILTGSDRMIEANAITVGFDLLRHSCAALALLLISSSVEMFLLSNMLAAVLALVPLRWLCRTVLGLPFRAHGGLATVRRALPFAAGMSLISLSWFLLGYLDKILLIGMMSPSVYSSYTLSYQVSGAMLMLATIVTQSLYPKINRLVAENDQAGISNLAGLATSAITVFAVTAFWITWMFEEQIARIIVSSDQRSSFQSSILIAFMAGMAFAAVWQVPYQLGVARGLLRPILICNCVAIPVFITAVLFFGMHDDGVSIAIVWMFIYVFYTILLGSWLIKRITVNFLTWLNRAIFIPAAAISLLAGLFIFFQRHMLVQLQPLYALLLAALFSLVFGLIGIYLSPHLKSMIIHESLGRMHHRLGTER